MLSRPKPKKKGWITETEYLARPLVLVVQLVVGTHCSSSMVGLLNLDFAVWLVHIIII